MGIVERKHKQKEDLRRQILDASLQLFIDTGFENVTIRKIADLIEYSPTTIYLYFKDKNEILFNIHEMGFGKLLEYNVNLAGIANPLLRLHKMGENYLRFALENPAFYDIMFLQTAPMQNICEGDWENGNLAFDSLRSLIQECFDTGLIIKSNIDAAAYGIWGMVHGLASLAIKDRLKKMIEDEKDMHLMLQESLNWIINTLDVNNK
ncbi:TetR/AcrR family transcriptional regulator [Parasediminibacterium sp. JCM 36343]|uniref:TetR/AcrR family transcriptional regulator n=1 Tax=Parasediminibacterium sp. JCM 36343 TaxID=3374279 RepID=UPI00397DEC69